MMLNLIKRLFGKELQVSKISEGALNTRHQAPEAQFSVSFDNNEIRLTVPDGRVFTVAWNELIGVAIQTTDNGPFQPDVFWVLSTKHGSLRIPQGANGERELFYQLQRLPGFNNEAFISAMGSAQNNLFVCWQRDGEERH
jgi:hypothetical protein